MYGLDCEKLFSGMLSNKVVNCVPDNSIIDVLCTSVGSFRLSKSLAL